MFVCAAPRGRVRGQLAPVGQVKRGFTLLELLVVLVIIGLLAGYVGPQFFKQIGKSESKTAAARSMPWARRWTNTAWTPAATPATSRA